MYRQGLAHEMSKSTTNSFGPQIGCGVTSYFKIGSCQYSLESAVGCQYVKQNNNNNNNNILFNKLSYTFIYFS